MGKNKTLFIDLSKTKGSGDFKCPRCGIKISPDDKSEDIYTILEPVMKEDRLEEVILQCNKCGTKIHLIGFHALEKLD